MYFYLEKTQPPCLCPIENSPVSVGIQIPICEKYSPDFAFIIIENNLLQPSEVVICRHGPIVHSFAQG